MNLKVSLVFIIKPFSLLDQNVMTKTVISSKRKELLRWFLKGFNKADETIFLKGKSLTLIQRGFWVISKIIIGNFMIS